MMQRPLTVEERNNETRSVLEAISQTYPGKIQKVIKQGDRIKLSAGLDYEVDDINAVEEICMGTPKGGIPYDAIYNHFKSDQKAVMNIFEEKGLKEGRKNVLPYSEVVKSKVGLCNEKAIAMQLYTQNLMESYLITGNLSEDENDFANFHAFNIILSPKKGPHIIDTENPILINGKINPYIVPIDKINRDTIIKLSQPDSDKRIYGVL